MAVSGRVCAIKCRWVAMEWLEASMWASGGVVSGRWSGCEWMVVEWLSVGGWRVRCDCGGGWRVRCDCGG